MAAAKTAFAGQTEILAQLAQVKSKVEESIELGRDNGNELKMLRRELGLDGQHGRLPIVEATLTRHESRMDRIDGRVDQLEKAEDETSGRQKLKASAVALLGGSAGGALMALIAHLAGIH